MAKLRGNSKRRRNGIGKEALNFTGDSGIDCSSAYDLSDSSPVNHLAQDSGNRFSPKNQTASPTHSPFNGNSLSRESTAEDEFEQLRQRDAEYFDSLETPCGQLSFCVFILCCLFVICTFAFPHVFERLKISETSEKLVLEWEGTKKLSICAFLSALGIGTALGLSCTCFTWSFTHFDSRVPGKVPPSPLADESIRRKSGHTFHLNYVMSILNGITLCLYSLWRMKDCFLVH